MRRSLLLIAASTIVSLPMLLPQGAVAAVATASGIRNALAKTSAVESVVWVCRHRFSTSRRHCFIDRSRPPTVCHHERMTSRRDCY
jgi:hypothetical protein